MYFNNSNAYLIATSSSNTCLLGLGNNCGVYFMQDDNNQVVQNDANKNSKARNPSVFVMP
jgi:hypothetical protein